jgi:murein DD-endopeptidase MepM/ murein hydrolase activator NlpD
MTDVDQLDHKPARRPRRRTRGLLIVLVASLLVPLLGGAQGSSVFGGDDLSQALAQQRALQQRIAAQKAAIAQLNELQSGLRDDISSTTTVLNGINADLDVAKARVAKMAADIAKVKAAYSALVQQLAQLDQQLLDIVGQEVAKQAQLEERKAILAQRLRVAYSTGEQSLIETVLSADSFADAIADIGYYLDIGDQDKALARQVVADQEALRAIHENVLSTRTQTEVLRLETAKQKKQLDARMVDLRKAQARLRALQAETARQLALQQAAYHKLAANKAKLRAKITAEAQAQASLKRKIDKLIADQFRYGNIPSQYNGTLIWPLNGILTQPFGCTGFSWEPPLGDCAHFHNGIDLAAPLGTHIKASGAGRVVYAGPLNDPISQGAYVVIIAHSANLQTWYAHLQTRIPVRVGQFVQQGQTIGYVGMTGNTTGPHLHWMVELNGTFVNPRLFV